MGVCGKVLAAGVASVRRGQGLPHAGQSWFQTAPTDPLQDTAEPSRAGGTSGNTSVRKGKTPSGSGPRSIHYTSTVT